VATLTGKQFFPHLISGPFHHGLVIVFSMEIAVLVIAAGTSLLRGRRYVHDEHGVTGQGDVPAEVTAEVAMGASSELGMEVAAEVDAEETEREANPQREAENRAK
jgi:hypothetical protein